MMRLMAVLQSHIKNINIEVGYGGVQNDEVFNINDLVKKGFANCVLGPYGRNRTRLAE
jgi:hypothetical protein